MTRMKTRSRREQASTSVDRASYAGDCAAVRYDDRWQHQPHAGEKCGDVGRRRDNHPHLRRTVLRHTVSQLPAGSGEGQDILPPRFGLPSIGRHEG